MAIKAVVLDLDGTLLRADGQPVAGVPAMLDGLRAAGLRLAVSSNQPGARGKLARAGLTADLLLDRASVGGNKGTKAWVAKACATFSIGAHELVWLGDGDLDMRSAVNSKVAYFNAGWSRPDYPYGINLLEPRLFGAVVRECFAKPVDWFCQFTGTDPAGRPVVARALTDSRGAGVKSFEDALRRLLKDRDDFALGPFQFGQVVALHLLGSIYGSGLAQTTDTWTVYPGSRGGTNRSLAPFVAAAARLFRDSYVDELLLRHTTATDSGQARFQGEKIGFGNQINTVHLNFAHRRRVAGKRVVVVDDFETAGFSLECARNLLLQAGATEVTGISIGKYHLRGHGLSRYLWAPVTDYAWDPYVATRHEEAGFRSTIVPLTTDKSAPTYFRESCARIADL